jgi:hypothetical protein
MISFLGQTHEDFTPQKNVHSSTWGSAEGDYPSAGSEGKWAPMGVQGIVCPDGSLGAKPPKEKLPCKCIF